LIEAAGGLALSEGRQALTAMKAQEAGRRHDIGEGEA